MSQTPHPTIAPKWLFLLIAAGLFATLMALLPHPPEMPSDRLGDKFNHMGAFATLAVLSRLAFPTAGRWRIVERLSFFGALIEVFQAIPELHRDCQWSDWVADTLAAGVAVVLAEAALRWWRARRG
ncbi:hypothetical protein GTZ99_12940 [Novosphingobium sp. FSY-8]|uniref:VanZ family protein n=1 Tax=Novosphingobium ovatum TaxID=1908523 RepID=A0ABW9XFX6_9SPHN|nr:hypothetical protein [Novosphingobium ovatum]NBC37455.1 hypothetical protein [Novosphingobium ovatum]